MIDTLEEQGDDAEDGNWEKHKDQHFLEVDPNKVGFRIHRS